MRTTVIVFVVAVDFPFLAMPLYPSHSLSERYNGIWDGMDIGDVRDLTIEVYRVVCFLIQFSPY